MQLRYMFNIQRVLESLYYTTVQCRTFLPFTASKKALVFTANNTSFVQNDTQFTLRLLLQHEFLHLLANQKPLPERPNESTFWQLLGFTIAQKELGGLFSKHNKRSRTFRKRPPKMSSLSGGLREAVAYERSVHKWSYFRVISLC